MVYSKKIKGFYPRAAAQRNPKVNCQTEGFRMEEERTNQPRRRRKPKNFFQRLMELPKKTLLTLLVIVVVFVAVIVVIAKSCSATPDTTVLSQAFSSQTELKLPLNTQLNEGDYLSYGGYQFESSKKLASLVKTVTKNNDGVTAASYTNAHGTSYLFTQQTDAGVDHWVLYQKDVANYSIFMGTHREVALDGSRLDILLPLHLISDSTLMDNMGAQIQPGTAYACGYDGMKDDETLAGLFRAYYEESGLYTVTSSDGGFTIVPKGSDKTLIFTFEEDGKSGMFAVNVPVSTEPEPASNASISYSGGEPVQLPEQDAISLSEIIVNASFRTVSTPTDTAAAYEVQIEDTKYQLGLTWSADTWNATVEGESGIATLTTKDSCMVAAIIGANDAGGVPARDDASWFGDLSADFSPAAAQMVTTGDINVRSAPSTSSDVLMTMPQDSSVAVIGVSDEWCEIWYNNQRAYMSSQYLKVTG